MTNLHLHSSQNHMATAFTFLLSIPKHRTSAAKYLMAELHSGIAGLENEITEFRDASPVHQLNHAPLDSSVEFTASGIDVLKRALLIEEATAGAFSPLAKSTGPDAGIEFNEQDHTVRRRTLGTWVGFGAIGKGFALDQVRQALLQEGFEDFILSAGGSSVVLSGFSDPSRHQPWHWGWSWQKDENGEPLGIPLVHQRGHGVALGISGTHEKGRHIQDPRTGLPAADRRSALVASPSAADADAFSTALFIDGIDKTLPHLENLGIEAAAAVIDADHRPRWNHLFQQFWGALTLLACTLSGIVASADDQDVDLGDVGLNDFTPYAFERNTWWVLLPVFALALVVLHLKDSRHRVKKHTSLEPSANHNTQEENHETTR